MDAIKATPTVISTAASTPIVTRSVFDIFWSCWATIFICTWTSMHPNIPPPGQSLLSALWKRLSLMFWALVVPELILTWAVKQWFAATAIEREFKQAHKWTKAHAHFLGMGGFTLAGRVGDGVSDVPKIPNLVVPIRPECPERPRGDLKHFWQEMKQYWEESARYRDSRRQFWADWERIQKDCSDYTYSTDSRQTQRKLNDYDKEDYQRLERYGHSLPDRIAYLSETPGTLSFYRFRDLVDKEIIALPTITAEEINDRAKGDFFSKAIAIFHTTWFIVQFVARCIQRLAITQLEVVTLALAALNGITYFFWWDKPLGVLQPVIVYPRGVIPFERNEDNSSFLVTALQTFRTAPQRLSSIFDSLRASASAFLDDQLEEVKTSKWYQLPILVLRCFFYLPIGSIIKSLFAIIDTSDIPPGAHHVPEFFATNVNSSNLDKYFIYFVLPFISIAFGGLHFIGWNFVFPTPTEQILWRVSCSCITAIPLITGFVWFLSQEGYLDTKVLLYPALTRPCETYASCPSIGITGEGAANGLLCGGLVEIPAPCILSGLAEFTEVCIEALMARLQPFKWTTRAANFAASFKAWSFEGSRWSMMANRTSLPALPSSLGP